MQIIVVRFPDPEVGRAAFLTQLVWQILAARLERGTK